MASPTATPPPMPSISPEHQKLLAALKQRVAPFLNPKRHIDEYLFRYLKARNFDLEKASQMFITSMNWRKENNIDAVLQTFPTSPYFKALMNYWPSSYIGESTTGYKVFYERLGAVEVRNLLKAVPLDALINYHVYILESQERERRRQIKSRGYSLPFINIQDCDGLGMKHAYTPGLDFLKALSKIDESNYPEMVIQIYFINTPAVFNVLYKMVSPFIPEQTMNKLKLDKEELLKLLLPENTPPQLGGTRQVAMPAGGLIEDKNVFAGKRTPVEAGAGFNEEIAVQIPGSTIHVHFSTESNDIGFALLFRSVYDDATVAPRPLIPSKRYDSHLTAIHLEYSTTEPGVYIASWDNSFSRWTAKNLYYHITEVTPVQQAQIADELLKVDPLMHNSNGTLLPKIKKN